MPIDNFIVYVFIFIDNFLKNIGKIRKSGPDPELTDSEVITIEIVGEFLGCGKGDKTIFDYFHQHWHSWFPKLNCRYTFAKQSANLWKIKEALYREIIRICLESSQSNIVISDGLPLPTCHIKRVRKNNPLRLDGAFSYCAAKDQKYFGFKGHLLTNDDGLILNFAIAPANVDERDVLPEVVDGILASITNLVIADKGLIRPSLKEHLKKRGIDLQTPLRDNMKDKRPKWLMNWAMNVRRIIETTNSQLVGRFNIQAIRAKDLWHFASKVLRKILAHSFAFMIAGGLEFDGILNG
jgi:IS5 family transposase